jgi:hypothetical protein
MRSRATRSIASLLASTHVARDPERPSISAAGTTASRAMVSNRGSLRPWTSRKPSGAASRVDHTSPPCPRVDSARGAGSAPQRNKASASGRYTSGMGRPSMPYMRGRGETKATRRGCARGIRGVSQGRAVPRVATFERSPARLADVFRQLRGKKYPTP